MTWPASFREKLYSGGVVRLAAIFEVVLPLSGEGVGTPWWAASDPRLGADGTLILGVLPGGLGTGIQIGPCSVEPQTWGYQEGAWSCSIHLPDGAGRQVAGPLGGALLSTRGGWGKAAEALRRGALCRLLIGEVGWARDQYQPLRIGRVQGVRVAHPDLLRVEAWDLATALRSRLSTLSTASGDEDKQLLFYGSTTSTTLSSGYTVGNTTLNVTATTPFNRETGGSGAVRITRASGASFYLTYTGTGAGTLTGVSTTGQFGSTATVAGSGAIVQAIPLLAGHPVEISRKLLTSTGLGTNGGRDTYPAAWAWGLDEAWVAGEDMRQLQALLQPSAGVYTWNALSDSAQEDALGWWSSYLSAAGLWPCTRQGKIVLRAARDPNTASALLAEAITDADALQDSLPEVQWWPSEVPTSYTRLSVAGVGSPVVSSSNVAALPASGTWSADLSDVLRGVAADSAIRTEVEGRLAPWLHLVPEVISLEVTGIRGYAPGDVLPLSLSGVRGRLRGTQRGYRDRPVMVLEESPDLSRNTTRLRLAALPSSLAEDGA